MAKKELQMNKFHNYQQATKVLTIREKVGQLFMPAAFINDSEQEIRNLERLISECAVGGICFFHSRASAATNFEGKKKVPYNENSFETLKKLIGRYQKNAPFPLLIAIDAEWGLAMRIENTPQYPYAITLGAIKGNSGLIFEVGSNIGSDCKAAGIHWNFAPVADINNNPDNPVIGYRSFGENKLEVAEKVVAFTKGLQSTGILTSVKHFPGHGDTDTDSHLGLPLINKSREHLLENELEPFRIAIENGVDAVMVGHLNVPALSGDQNIPSVISEKIVRDLLREELGFRGVVVTDALNMHAVSRMFQQKGELEWLAFDAGNDVLCFAEHIREGMLKIVNNASVRQIEESFERVWRLKEKAFHTPASISKSLINPDDLNKKLANASLTIYKGAPVEIENLKERGLIGIELSENSDNQFFKIIVKKYPLKVYSTSESDLENLKGEMDQTENVLVALFPPKAKPQNNFEIPDRELDFINKLINQKNVILYLFGNPYVLNLIDLERVKVAVIAYQDFKVFQENAAGHFLGRVRAKGVLPVSIGKWSDLN